MTLKRAAYRKSEQVQRMLDGLWNINDVLKRLPVTSQSITNWRKNDFPSVVIKGEGRPALRFVPDDVAAWSKQHGFVVPADIRGQKPWPRKLEEPSLPKPQQQPKMREPGERIEWTRNKKPELAALFMSLDQDVRPTYEQQAKILGCNSDSISGLRVRFGLQERKLRDPKTRKTAIQAALRKLMNSNEN
jgi:hypothetical protein